MTPLSSDSSQQSMTSHHQQYMAQAIDLAKRGSYTASPNPCVGCVIVKDGQIVGRGWHYKAGEAHAEIHALNEAGDQAKGADVYVSLEPCAHHGKTGPCSKALLNAGVAKVYVAMQDPNPQVAGAGLQQLRDAGIALECGLLEAQAKVLNLGFIKRMQTGLPRVTVKLAMSLDGRTAMESGESQWITGAEARADVQRLRARSCAIVTGADTVLQDNPRLNVRRDDEPSASENIRQPLRVVIDSRRRVSSRAKIFLEQGASLWLVGDDGSGITENTATVSAAELEVHAATEVHGLPVLQNNVDLKAVLENLASRQCNEVLVEAGATLAGAFLDAGLVDHFVVYTAPVIMGRSARPLFDISFDTMAQRVHLRFTSCTAIGDDLRIDAVPVEVER